MLDFSERGDNEAVDMLVGDIYGQDYSKLGLKSTMIASSFGKVFKKGDHKRSFRPEDISKSLLYAISNNIGQIAYVFPLSVVYMSTAALTTREQLHECGEVWFGPHLLRWLLHSWAPGHDSYAFVCYSLLEQGNQARVIPATRRLPVRGHPVILRVAVLRDWY